MADEEHVVEENGEETVESEKKIRNTVLDTFRKITHDKEQIVVKNGTQLLKHLVENKEDEKGKSEIKYTLGRLIRGLGASTHSSKKGFYTVLSGLFHCVDDVTITDILEFAEKELHTSGGNTKSENADISTGQILLYGAIIRSGLFEKASDSEKKLIIEQLLTAGKKRNYLYLLSVTFILELCKNINEKTFKSKIWGLISPEVMKPWSEQNIDTVYLLYSLRERFPNIVNGKFMQQSLGTAEVCASETLGDLANILINIPRLDVANHPIYEIISKPLSQQKFIVSFINEADKFFIRLNYNRHIVLTLLLTSILQNLATYEDLPQLFTKNYVQQTLQYFKTVKSSKNPEQLQEKIYQLFDVIVEVLKKDGVSSEVKIETLKRFIFYPGIFIFEKITRSKIVQQITAVLDAEGVKMLGELYKEVILGRNERVVKDEVQKWLNNDKIYAAQLLVKLFGHPAMHGEMDWKAEQLKFLLDMSLFKLDGYDHIGVELAASLKDTFFRALAVKMPKLDDVRNLLSSLVDHIEELLTAETNPTILRNPLSEDAFETWTKSITTIKTLQSKSQKKNKLYPVFRTLFLHLTLQLFNDVKLSKDSLEELFNCYARIQKAKTDDELRWIEVVVDLFLNLLSHNSYLLRNMVNCVFPHLCKHLDATSVHQILDVLDPENENNPLMQDDSDDSDDDDEEVDENEEDEDSELSDGDDEETVNDKLKDAVRLALGGYQTDEESVNLDDLSDSEGKKLDDALAVAFKQFKPNVGKKSKKQKKEDEALTHFRIRALDLIDIYLDSEPSMFLCLEVMVPLLRLLEFSTKDAHQTPLLNRVRASLKKLSNVKKFSGLDDITESVLPDLFASLLEKGEKNTLIVQIMGDKIADCCLFIIRCSQYVLNSEEITKKTKKHLKKKIEEITANALESFFVRRESLTPYVLFKSIFQMTSKGNFELFQHVSTYIFSEKIRPFRKTQALELAKIFFSNHRLLSSGEAPEDFAETLEEFTRNAENLVNQIIENPENGKEKFMRSFFVLLSTIKQSPVKDLVDFSSLIELVKIYRSMVNFTGETKKAFNKLCRSLGVDTNVPLKETLLKFSNLDDIPKGKKLKKDKIKSKKGNAKLKKETRQLRMESLSGGLKIDFGNVDVATIADVDSDDSTDAKRKSEDVEVVNKKKFKNGKNTVTINGDVSKKRVNGHVDMNGEVDESIEGESPGRKRKIDGKTTSKKSKKIRS